MCKNNNVRSQEGNSVNSCADFTFLCLYFLMVFILCENANINVLMSRKNDSLNFGNDFIF